MAPTRFEELERLNAQIDVWIDQEEFDHVIGSFKYAPVDKEGKERNFKEHLESAFSHDYCTNHLDEEWNDLFEVSTPPLSKFRLPSNNKWVPFSKDKDDPELENVWSRFFWAKLIRAKIQQKGSDCYFGRLDQVVVYLERNLPFVKKNSGLTNKLVVIYLLEMAAAGEGADQRSFAERARRILREHFKGKNGETACFYDFYDLLARYTIGLGFQHEGQNRKAVLEFNWIIKELNGLWSEEGTLFQPLKKYKWANYVDERYGLDFLYLPAVLGRTGIEIKIQLAYHALETIDNYWKSPENDYLEAKKGYLQAEAYRLMGELGTSKKELRKVAAVLCSRHQDKLPKDWLKLFEKIEKVCGQKWANIQGRLLDTYVALHLDKLKESSISNGYIKTSLEQINKILPTYWKASKWQATDRKGYLELVAAYLGWIAGRKTEEVDPVDTVDSGAIAERIYKKNREYLINIQEDSEDKNNQTQSTCLFCTELGIELERLGASHYQEFVKNMQRFYGKFKKKFNLGKDPDRFQQHIFDVEREHKEDSAYQKREMVMNNLGDDEFVPPGWCKKCLDKKTAHRDSFSGLLKCADSHKNDNQPELSLGSEHYEHLMDNWDKRFRNHLETESVHLPHCKALHLLGLQRWNSTSPAIGRSLGGGYLVYHTDKRGQVDLGVAVDPGFDFVRNLFHLGFSLSDIDVVLLSHAHLDHIRDFESLITLCLELKKRHPDKVKRRLHTIMTLGVYRRLSHIFASPGLREFVEPYILDIEKEIKPDFVKPYINDLKYYDYDLNPNGNNPKPEFNSDRQGFVFREKPDRKKGSTDRGRFRFLAETPLNPKDNRGLRLSVIATRAYHNDFSEYSDSFGFKINIFADGRDVCSIGYTGDTSWSPDIIDQYKDCNALLVHIGSLIDREKKTRFDNYEKEGKECWKLTKKKNHPYLFGLLRFLTQITDHSTNGKVPLILLSEFGEELRGRIRLDLFQRLRKAYSVRNTEPDGNDAPRKLPLLPLDVGLDVILHLDGPIDGSNNDKRKRNCTQLRELLKKNEPPFLVNCVSCKEFVVPQQIDFETYGYDEALYCVCQTCRRSTPQNVLQGKLRDLYEVARPLQSYY